MQTANDLDLELIFSLGEEIEKKCEGGTFHDEHLWGHADGKLWYARVDGDCKDVINGVLILCDGFISDCERVIAKFNAPLICSDCRGPWMIQRLEPVE